MKIIIEFSAEEISGLINYLTAIAETVDFTKIVDSEKLETIKAEVIKRTKKGKSGTIKKLLEQFRVNRVSELSEEDYNDFYAELVKI